MKYKIKSWHVYLLSILVVGVSAGIIFNFYNINGIYPAKAAGSFVGEAIIWGGIGFIINYLLRNTSFTKYVIYVIVSSLMVFGMWYGALNSNNSQYIVYSIGFTVAVIVNTMYHFVKQTRNKKTVS